MTWEFAGYLHTMQDCYFVKFHSLSLWNNLRFSVYSTALGIQVLPGSINIASSFFNQAQSYWPVIELSGNFRPCECYVAEKPLLIKTCNSVNNNRRTLFWISHYNFLSVLIFSLFPSSVYAFFPPLSPCLSYTAVKSLSHNLSSSQKCKRCVVFFIHCTTCRWL